MTTPQHVAEAYFANDLSSAVTAGQLTISDGSRRWYEGGEPSRLLVSKEHFNPYRKRKYYGSFVAGVEELKKGIIVSLKNGKLKRAHVAKDDYAHDPSKMSNDPSERENQDLIGKISGTVVCSGHANFFISCESVPLIGEESYGNEFVTVRTDNFTKPGVGVDFTLVDEKLTVPGGVMLTRLKKMSASNIGKHAQLELGDDDEKVYRLREGHPVCDMVHIHKKLVLQDTSMSEEEKRQELQIQGVPIEDQFTDTADHRGNRVAVATGAAYEKLLPLAKDFIRRHIPLGNVTGEDLVFKITGDIPDNAPSMWTKDMFFVDFSFCVSSVRTSVVTKTRQHF
jgi:hypothetical protein